MTLTMVMPVTITLPRGQEMTRKTAQISSPKAHWVLLSYNSFLHICTFQMRGRCDFKISRFRRLQDFKISRLTAFQDFNISRLTAVHSRLTVRSNGNLEILKSWRLSTLKSWNLERRQPWNLEILKPPERWNLEISKSRNVEMLKSWISKSWTGAGRCKKMQSG